MSTDLSGLTGLALYHAKNKLRKASNRENGQNVRKYNKHMHNKKILQDITHTSNILPKKRSYHKLNNNKQNSDSEPSIQRRRTTTTAYVNISKTDKENTYIKKKRRRPGRPNKKKKTHP
eukprot:123403_1